MSLSTVGVDLGLPVHPLAHTLRAQGVEDKRQTCRARSMQSRITPLSEASKLVCATTCITPPVNLTCGAVERVDHLQQVTAIADMLKTNTTLNKNHKLQPRSQNSHCNPRLKVLLGKKRNTISAVLDLFFRPLRRRTAGLQPRSLFLLIYYS